MISITHILAGALLGVTSLAFAADETPTAIVPTKPITLFDGKSLDGWVGLAKQDVPTDQIWTVKDGVIHCAGKPAGYLRTVQTYADYLLTVEWRFIKPGNTGVLVHANGDATVWQASLECQGAHDHQGDFFFWGGLKCDQPFNKGKIGVAAATPGVEKPLGEWNTYQVKCEGDTVTIMVNGAEVNKITGCSSKSGGIGLQSEGAELEVRKVVIEPLH